MNNLNESLIQKLTWALIETTTVDGKPNIPKIAEALEAALTNALMSQNAANQLQAAILRTAKVMGE